MSSHAISTKGRKARIAVAGAGMIGLACAFELSRRGHAVTVFDPAGPRETTSWAAAGMIAPAFETLLHGGGPDTPLARLCFESARLWPGFAKAIRAASGLPAGYDDTPTVALARTREDEDRLEALRVQLADAGHSARWLAPDALRRTAGLAGGLASALELPTDHQVDNRKLLQALRTNRGPGTFQLERRAIADFNDLRGDGFDAIVWARGARERGVETLVKGQAIALQPGAGLPAQVIRFGAGYIVPKADRIIIGATSEEDYSHAGVTETATGRLLDAAIGVLPALARFPVIEAWTGLRPKREGGVPLIGEVAPGQFVASAHFRNGILLAPATAACIADLIEGKPASWPAAAFAPASSCAPA